MTRYVIRRLIALVAMMAAVLVVTFTIFFALQSNPALKACGKLCTPEKLHAVEHKLQLDKPKTEQFYLYVKGVFAGRDFGDGDAINHCPAPCLGYSFKTDQPVTTLILDRAPVTFSIAIGAAFLWLVGGIGAGVVSALRSGTRTDRAIVGVATASLSLPIQLVALSLLLVLCAKGGLSYPHYVNFKDDPFSWAGNLVLPWVALAFIYSAVYARLMRTQMVEAMQEDFVRTARGKGLSEGRVAYKHALRAALPPLIVVFGLDLGGLLGGAIITERIFGMPGLGTLAYKSVIDLDLPIILGVTLFGAFVILLANLIADIAYAASDPKVAVS